MRLILDIETDSAPATKIWCCVTKDIDSGEVTVWKEASGLNQYLKAATTIVMHNGIAFDQPVLNRLWKTEITRNQVIDSLVLSRLLNPNRENGHSLESWGERLGLPKTDYKAKWGEHHGVVLDKKSTQHFDEPVMDILVDYCIQDVNVTEKLYDYLLKEQKQSKKETSAEAVELEYAVQYIIAEQVRNGFKIDLPHAMSTLSDIKHRMHGIESEMEVVFPTIVRERYSEKTGKRLKDDVEVFNPGSRKQIYERLKEKYNWKPSKTTEKGTPTVDEDVLAGLPYPEAKFLAEYFMLQKRASQLESWLEKVEEDGRVHGDVITIGAVTGRCTHSNPNMAQVPAVRAPYGKDMRSCWVVDRGNVLVGCDLSGIELRCFAHYLNDEDYAREVVSGDVHTRNQMAFGVPTRDDAKTVLYAMLYGASPTKIGSIIGKSAMEGSKIIGNFMSAVPAYANLKSKVERLAERGWLPGLDGRVLHVRSTHSALNTLLQACGAIIAKQWLVEMEKMLKERCIPYKLVAFVHDEVQIETKEEFGDEVGKIAVAAAQKAGEVLNFRCPVDAEYKVGKTWADCH